MTKKMTRYEKKQLEALRDYCWETCKEGEFFGRNFDPPVTRREIDVACELRSLSPYYTPKEGINSAHREAVCEIILHARELDYEADMEKKLREQLCEARSRSRGCR